MTELFCERLRRLRENKHMTVNAVAKHLGVTFSVIARAENGEHMVRAFRLEPMARLFGVSLDYLLTGREPPQVAALHAAIRRGDSHERLLAMIPPKETAQ